MDREVFTGIHGEEMKIVDKGERLEMRTDWKTKHFTQMKRVNMRALGIHGVCGGCLEYDVSKCAYLIKRNRVKSLNLQRMNDFKRAQTVWPKG